MRFPLALYQTVGGYLIKKWWEGAQRYPLVLMLEPTLKCNLDCIGCGRIAEYQAEPWPDMSIEECLQSADECGAPIVSVCGGEPLLYQGVGDLISELIARKKYVYLCTNGMFLDRFWDRVPPDPRLALSIHLDGLKETHDHIVAKEGVFDKVMPILEEAKARGYRTCTNTTVMRGTNPDDVVGLFDLLATKGVDGILVSSVYPQEGEKAKATLERQEIEAMFGEIFRRNGHHPFNNTPLYRRFLAGERELTCSPWATPNRTVRGWKGPCYVLTDGYYETYQELIDKTDWDNLGPGKDPRCENCKIHCGFEPTTTLGTNSTLRDHFEMAKWNLFG